MAVDLSTRLQESVLEFSALIEVALLSLSQIQHRRRLNGHPISLRDPAIAIVAREGNCHLVEIISS